MLAFFVALLPGGVAAGTLDIRSSKHNLSGVAATDEKLDERQICIFCHTPSIDIGGQQTSHPANSRLRWQSSVARDHSFVMYDDIGRMGLGKPSVGSQSIACLSCHDWVQAFGTIGDNKDHPFAVPYRGEFSNPDSELSNRHRSTWEHLQALEDFRAVSQGTVENRTILWVSPAGVTTRRTRTDLPLYSRPDAVSGLTGTPHVECSSCHDPHNANNQMFLRLSGENQSLCFTCHIK